MTANDMRARAADIIEPHLSGARKLRDRAESQAAMLDYSGHLGTGRPDAQERVANHHPVATVPAAPV